MRLHLSDSDGQTYDVTVDPAEMSDRARAVAAQFGGLGAKRNILIVSKRPLRESIRPGEMEQALLFHGPATLGAPQISHWSGWSPWAGPEQSRYRTPLEYLESQVAKIPEDDWWIDELVSSGEAARMAGISASTWRDYAADGRVPRPDDAGDLSMPARARRPRWMRSTVARWMAQRPGQGARTDRGAAATAPAQQSGA